MTSYDTVWTHFTNKCKIDDLEIPNSDAAIYDTIQNALLKFNIHLDENVSGDNSTELLSRDLDGNELLLIIHCIRLIILENQVIYFSSTYAPFTKELGVRNLGTQMNRLETLVENEKKEIQDILMKMMDDFL
ncbi:hypothetical protein [Halobacillus litoralis]|uniref:hypothetical protein n=1 Tax=Halobacillus litoralis TaxID=45668 RepID=UPI001CD510D7|nr:hypothetical protein [Halobacillus litoralis]MCA1021642.1 hypothetical protein [Halobacillus litoralis]